MEKEFEIWMSGFAVTGQSQGASFIGISKGKTFKKACEDYKDADGEKLKLDNYPGRPSIWACELYDNEKDARKSFG